MTCSCPTCGQRLPDGRLVLDVKQRALVGDGRSARFSPQQMIFLITLVRGVPGVVHTDQIILAIWDGDEPDDVSNAMRVRVSQLRRKLRPFGLLIRNAFGTGYALEGPAVSLGELKEFTRRRAA